MVAKTRRRAKGISAAHQYFSAEAVVLRSGARGEFDAYVILCSPQYGLLTLKMPGVRRARSKLKPFKEPAIHAELHCYGKPNQNRIPTLLTGRILGSFESLRTSYGKLKCALSILRFSELFLTPFDPKAKEKFLLLIETMNQLTRCPDSVGRTPFGGFPLLAYKLKVLDLSGWRFSASDAARTILDDKMLGHCENLENESEFQGQDLEFNDLQKLEYVVNDYVEKLIIAGV